jgi:hypothetical protein
LPSRTDVASRACQVRKVPILLQKAFWGDDRNFSGPLMRFARGDMRDHIVSHQNDQGASYRRYGVLQWPRRLKINFCEIFDVVRFSTFATISARSGSQFEYFTVEDTAMWDELRGEYKLSGDKRPRGALRPRRPRTTWYCRCSAGCRKVQFADRDVAPPLN